MSFWYASFCDRTLPRGSQFVGAAVIEAADERAAADKARSLKKHAEIAIWPMTCTKVSELPNMGQVYLNCFVPRDVVLAEGGYEAPAPDLTVCQDCNP